MKEETIGEMCCCDARAEDIAQYLYMGTQNGEEIECCIISPTPISKRKHPDRPATLQIAYTTGIKTNCIEIPIAYCPVCGRKL